MTVSGDESLRDDRTPLRNLGWRERQIRLVAGIVMLVAGAVITAVLASSSSTAWWWAIVLLIVYYQGVRFVLDYRTGTCPLLSELGQRRAITFPTFGEKLSDLNAAEAIRSISRRALVQAVGAAVGLLVVSEIVILVAAR